MVDGNDVKGYFATDFTSADIAKLDAVQPLWFRDHSYDRARLKVITLAQVFQEWQETWWNGGSGPGLYMELKHPKYHSRYVRGFLIDCLLLVNPSNVRKRWQQQWRALILRFLMPVTRIFELDAIL
jgi:hypothetical protein